QHAVIYFAIPALGWHTHRVEATLPRDLQAARFGTIRDHHGDGSLDRARGDVVRDGLEVRSTAGQQDAQPLHRYSTRGRPRLCGATTPMRTGFSPNLRSSSATVHPSSGRKVSGV